ncbi:MAG: hypothetical protein ABJL99_08935 [Aliishimia sp.]
MDVAGWGNVFACADGLMVDVKGIVFARCSVRYLQATVFFGRLARNEIKGSIGTTIVLGGLGDGRLALGRVGRIYARNLRLLRPC